MSSQPIRARVAAIAELGRVTVAIISARKPPPEIVFAAVATLDAIANGRDGATSLDAHLRKKGYGVPVELQGDDEADGGGADGDGSTPDSGPPTETCTCEWTWPVGAVVCPTCGKLPRGRIFSPENGSAEGPKEEHSSAKSETSESGIFPPEAGAARIAAGLAAIDRAVANPDDPMELEISAKGLAALELDDLRRSPATPPFAEARSATSAEPVDLLRRSPATTPPFAEVRSATSAEPVDLLRRSPARSPISTQKPPKKSPNGAKSNGNGFSQTVPFQPTPAAVDHPVGAPPLKNPAPDPQSAKSAQVVTQAVEGLKSSGWWCNRHGLVGAKRVVVAGAVEHVCAKCEDPVTWWSERK